MTDLPTLAEQLLTALRNSSQPLHFTQIASAAGVPFYPAAEVFQRLLERGQVVKTDTVNFMPRYSIGTPPQGTLL